MTAAARPLSSRGRSLYTVRDSTAWEADGACVVNVQANLAELANWRSVKRYGLLMEVGGFKVAQMPMPAAWSRGQAEVGALADRMLLLHRRVRDISVPQERSP